MLDRITEALKTRRRLGGAVLLLAGIVVAVVVLWPGGGDDGSTRTGSDGGQGKRLPVRIVSVPPLGLAFAHPKTWSRVVGIRVISLRSPDRSIQIVLSSPLARPARAEVETIAKSALLKRFAPAKIVHEGTQSLGGQPADSFEVLGRDGNLPVRALVYVDSTDYRTYTITLLTGEHPSRQGLTEARRILATVRFGKPSEAKQ